MILYIIIYWRRRPRARSRAPPRSCASSSSGYTYVYIYIYIHMYRLVFIIIIIISSSSSSSNITTHSNIEQLRIGCAGACGTTASRRPTFRLGGKHCGNDEFSYLSPFSLSILLFGSRRHGRGGGGRARGASRGSFRGILPPW